MAIKKRTLNELRQTKDSYYVTPRTGSNNSNLSIVEGYMKYMREENRMSQASIKNFMLYLEMHDLRIVKG